MKILKDTYKKTGNLHHAYLLEGEKENSRKRLFNFIEKDLEQPIQANPDFWHQQFETFAIDDARALKEVHALKSFSQNKKIFILETVFMTNEAQNALLKVFEEPTPNTHFFIIMPSSDVLLPTLRSRLFIISRDVNTGESSEGEVEAKKFLALPIPDRLKKVALLAEEKDKLGAINLVEHILKIAHAKKYPAALLEDLLKTRSYLNDRSPSLKLLLEHIALTIPVS
jgi:DNA polymerase III delta prime subunit